MSILSRPERRGRRRRWFLLVVIVPLVAGAPVAARPAAAMTHASATSPPSRDRARRLFEQAERHFHKGRYRAALRDYDRAFRMSGLPGFLLNMADCQGRLQNEQEARRLYQRYLDITDERAPHRAAVARALEGQEVRPAPPTLTPEATPSVAPERLPPGRRLPERPAMALPATAAADAGLDVLAAANERELKQGAMQPDAWKHSDVPHRGRTAGYWIWPAAAVAVLGVGVGVFFALKDTSGTVEEGSLGTLSR